MNTPRATNGPARPVPEQARFASLDIVRGFAVLGILIMNIWSAAAPREVWDYPMMVADLPGAAVETWMLVQVLFEGSQRTLFSMLFGAGGAMIISRLLAVHEPRRARGIYFRRTGWLVVFGLVNAYLFFWPADILYVYGLCGFALYPLFRLSNRALVAILAVTLLVPTAIRFSEIATLEAAQQQYLAAGADESFRQAWEDALKKARPSASDEQYLESVRVMRDGEFGEIFRKNAISSLVLQTIVALKWFLLDALAAMIVGMLLFRVGVLTLNAPSIRRRLFVLLIAGYGIGLPVSLWETLTVIGTDFDPRQFGTGEADL